MKEIASTRSKSLVVFFRSMMMTTKDIYIVFVLSRLMSVINLLSTSSFLHCYPLRSTTHDAKIVIQMTFNVNNSFELSLQCLMIREYSSPYSPKYGLVFPQHFFFPFLCFFVWLFVFFWMWKMSHEWSSQWLDSVTSNEKCSRLSVLWL